MVRIVVILLLSTAIVSPGAAQDLLGGYFAHLGSADMHNSMGKVLKDFCAVVQQDRANYHKFGKRHEWDGPDPWFATLEMRKVISANCRVAPDSEYIPPAVLRGEPRFVRVQVFGRGGVPHWVEVHEGAG